MNKLTQQDIDNTIVETRFYHIPSTTHTICCLILRNGFSLIGESSCVDPVNFDMAVGQKIAFENAKDKIWALEGYLLRNEIWLNTPASGNAEENTQPPLELVSRTIREDPTVPTQHSVVTPIEFPKFEVEKETPDPILSRYANLEVKWSAMYDKLARAFSRIGR